MVWKWFSKNTEKPSPQSSETLVIVASLERQQERFLAVIAEKDAQIRMVLEERFFRPIMPPAEHRAKSTSSVHPEELTDVTTFSSEGDREQLEHDNAAARDAERELGEALRSEVKEIAAEQRGETPTAEPAAMLERLAPQVERVRSREERAEAATRAIMERQL